MEGKNVKIDDVKLFDQFTYLCNFVEDRLKDPDFEIMLAHEKWVSYFESRPCGGVYSELLKISQFFFCIMGHNANLERIFSLMDVQWTSERENLSVESVKSMLQVLYNFESMSC